MRFCHSVEERRRNFDRSEGIRRDGQQAIGRAWGYYSHRGGEAARHDISVCHRRIMWRPRQSDLRKIVRLQNRGEIDRIYTRNMRDALVEDLATLKQEKGI